MTSGANLQRPSSIRHRFHRENTCVSTPWDAASVSLPLRFTTQRTNQTVQLRSPFRKIPSPTGPALASQRQLREKPREQETYSTTPTPHRKTFFRCTPSVSRYLGPANPRVNSKTGTFRGQDGYQRIDAPACAPHITGHDRPVRDAAGRHRSQRYQ